MTDNQFRCEQIAWAWMNEAATSSRILTKKEALAGVKAYLILESVGLQDLRLGRLASLPGYLRDAARTYVNVRHRIKGFEIAFWRSQVLLELNKGDNRSIKNRPKSGSKLPSLKPGPVPRGFALKAEWKNKGEGSKA